MRQWWVDGMGSVEFGGFNHVQLMGIYCRYIYMEVSINGGTSK